MAVFQQVLLMTGNSGLIPPGDPVVLDFSFPGLVSNITSGPIYTFAQDVMFPMNAPPSFGGTSGVGLVCVGSSATITQNTASGSEIVQFVITTNAQVTTPAGDANWGIYAYTLVDGVELLLETTGATQGTPYTGVMPLATSFTNPNLGGGFIYAPMAASSGPPYPEETWLSAHHTIVGPDTFMVFHAGESLYLRPLSFWGTPTFFEDLSLQLLGTAV